MSKQRTSEQIQTQIAVLEKKLVYLRTKAEFSRETEKKTFALIGKINNLRVELKDAFNKEWLAR